MHGAAASAAQWDALSPALLTQRPVLALELPGHGQTPAGGVPFTTRAFAEYLIGFMDRQQIAEADVLGYSLGGYVALHAATQHPQRFGRIITLATKFFWTPETAARETDLLRPDAIRQKVPHYARDLDARHQPPNHWEAVLANTAALIILLGANNLLSHAALGRIETPVLLLLGDRDKMVTLEETTDAYRSLPNGQLAILPATPHALEQVDAALLRTIVGKFLN